MTARWLEYVEERPKTWRARRREWRDRRRAFRKRCERRRKWLYHARMLLRTQMLSRRRFEWARRFMSGPVAGEWCVGGESLLAPAEDLLLPVEERKAWQRTLTRS